MNKAQEIASKYQPKSIEKKWYNIWIKNQLFNSVPNNKEAYSIVIPPPNVTGILHMGHMLNNTIQDVLTRKARMDNKNACWVPGTDHASIATESKVVNMLRENGLTKWGVGREKFLEYAFDWKEKYGGIILEQLKTLGASCDWNRTRFTMEDKLSEQVIECFLKLYEDGYIYRGERMINWDPEGLTALSDEEVLYEEKNTQLHYLKYKFTDSDNYLTVATTRPETIFGDVAICINPKDERYQQAIGKKVIVPLVNREVEIIADDYVDPDFGTGCLKITPAHDSNDFAIGEKFNLPVINSIDEKGILNNEAGNYQGLDRFIARKKIIKDLINQELLIKSENYTTKIGISERTKAVVEPRISLQWFVDMKKFIADHPQVLSSVENGEIQFHPAKFKNTYRHWIENIKDWCISRQLWWGHRIPAWYLPSGEIVVAQNETEALEKAKAINPNIKLTELKQDEDVLDTWFSSWLWPFAVFNGLIDKNNQDVNYYYPTNDLVTGPDIIFFWVARMIMAGYYFMDKKPFNNVYFTGIVRDSKGRKMSKSLGNSPDPQELIEKYGTDGVRMGLLFSAPAGNDLLFDENLCEQGRNFCNKIWNAFRLIQSWDVNHQKQEHDEDLKKSIIPWMKTKLNEATNLLTDKYKEFRLSEGLKHLYQLIWTDFCSWYLEAIKPSKGDSISQEILKETEEIFSRLLELLHPFMPFITEEIWQQLNSSSASFINQQQIHLENNLKANSKKQNAVFELIKKVRSLKMENALPSKAVVKLYGINLKKEPYSSFQFIVQKLAQIEYVEVKHQNSIAFLIGKDEFECTIEGYEPKSINTDALKIELSRLEGFLKGINAKLSNQKFIENAKPAVVEREKIKQSDTLSKIESIRAELAKN